MVNLLLLNSFKRNVQQLVVSDLWVSLTVSMVFGNIMVVICNAPLICKCVCHDQMVIVGILVLFYCRDIDNVM